MCAIARAKTALPKPGLIRIVQLAALKFKLVAAANDRRCDPRLTPQQRE